jgi:hypothetical protein
MLTPLEKCSQTLQEVHGSARWLKTESVEETFAGRKIWEGDVHTFQVGPESEKCYAWAETELSPITEVLGIGPISCAQDAVRAALVHRIRSQSDRG